LAPRRPPPPHPADAPPQDGDGRPAETPPPPRRGGPLPPPPPPSGPPPPGRGTIRRPHHAALEALRAREVRCAAVSQRGRARACARTSAASAAARRGWWCLRPPASAWAPGRGPWRTRRDDAARVAVRKKIKVSGTFTCTLGSDWLTGDWAPRPIIGPPLRLTGRRGRTPRHHPSIHIHQSIASWCLSSACHLRILVVACWNRRCRAAGIDRQPLTSRNRRFCDANEIRPPSC